MANSSPAPAAVDDTRCALRWVFRNAPQWHFDTSKIVLMGHSAGEHLSLITGMVPDGTGLDNQCYGTEKPRVQPTSVLARQQGCQGWFSRAQAVDLRSRLSSNNRFIRSNWSVPISHGLI